MIKTDKIYIAGHSGLVGSALMRLLTKEGFNNLVYQTRDELDLQNKLDVDRWFAHVRPKYVIIAAARVGGILDNDTHPVEFLYENLMIASNVIHAAHEYGVEKLLNLGSACIYPKDSQQPIKEEYFMTGKLEPTNDAYAIAKIAAIKLCQAYHRQYGDNFISAMPTNLYGPGDTFNDNYAHVLPALLHKLVVAKETNQPFIKVWGSGKPRREFMFVDDLARALL
ncbi:MAG: NAD-dependent epimerase/dehydratase family protein, partial [Patescibacteria group bacterium]